MPTKSVTAVIGLFDGEVHDARAAPPAISAACASTAASAPPTPPAIAAIRSPRCLLRLSPMIPTVPRWQRPSILRVVTAPRTRRARSATFALRTIAYAPPSRHGTPPVRRRHGHHAAGGRHEGRALPELLNFEEPQVITDIQRQYVEAGCDVITANTFGATPTSSTAPPPWQMSLPPPSPAPRGRRPLCRRRYRPHRRTASPLGHPELRRGL